MSESVLKVFLCTDHDGFYPVGVASVIVAQDEAEARSLLDAALGAKRLKPGTGTLTELDTSRPLATVLLDGDY